MQVRVRPLEGLVQAVPFTLSFLKLRAAMLFALGVLMLSLFFPNSVAAACTTHDMTGFAWSTTAGWISFSCPFGSPIDYGVDINDADDSLVGHAWNSAIGWIDFTPSGTPPSGTAGVTVDTAGGVVTGWARACSVFASGCSGVLKPDSERGGWEGWIHFNGANYATTVNESTGVLDGYAWGHMNVGWISMNGITQSGEEYGVELTASLAINISGDGSVNANPPGSTCVSSDPDTCTFSYPRGTEVVLDPNPASGSVFLGWNPGSVCDSVSGDICTVTVDSDKAILATFGLEFEVATEQIEDVGRIGDNEAPLPGTVTIRNNVDTTVYFRYGEYAGTPPATCAGASGFRTTPPEIIDPANMNSINFEHIVADLVPGSDFYYCAVAEQGSLTKYGAVESAFETRIRPIYENF